MMNKLSSLRYKLLLIFLKICLPFAYVMALCQATDQQKELILKEINETTDTKLEDNKKIIKQWMDNQLHLPHNYDERILPSFIRGCKHDLERVKRKLDCYFTSRALMPDLFRNRDPQAPELRAVTNSFVVFTFPKLTPDGCRITYHGLQNEDASKIDVPNIIKLLMMIGDIRIVEEGPISGDVYIFDMLYAKPNHLTRLISPMVKRGIAYSQNAMPQRLKEIHILNAPSYIDTGLNFVKMFVKQKIKDRFHVHNVGSDGIFKFIPKDNFPSDLGGKEKSTQALQDDWWKKLEHYSSYFEKQELVCSDESKRTFKTEASCNEYDEMYGTVGSFHKLNID